MVSVFDLDLAIVLGPFALSHKKCLFNTSCLSVRLNQLGSQRTNISQSGTGDFHENLSKDPQIWLKSDKNIGLFTWKHEILLHCWRQRDIFCSSTTAQRETTLVFPWRHRPLFHCWQLHPGEQYKGNLLLRSHVSNAYAKAAQYYMYIVSFIQMVTSWRNISILPYLTFWRRNYFFNFSTLCI